MSQKANVSSLDGGPPESISTLALRGGLSGEFVDFHLLPALLADFDGSPRNAAIGRWAELLVERGFDARHIDPGGGRLEAEVAAEGARRLADRTGLTAEGQVTDAGQAVAALAERDPAKSREFLASLLRPRVEAALAGQGGAPILPLLKRAAQSLAVSKNLWVQVCPALMPTEVGAIVHWACIDFAHAEALVRDIEINRDVAMHRVGVPPDPDAPPGANLERHWERVMEFYSGQSRLGGRVPFSFGEELALVKLIGFCGLMREAVIGPGCAVLTKN